MRILRVAELVECPVGCRSVLEPATFSCKYRIRRVSGVAVEQVRHHQHPSRTLPLLGRRRPPCRCVTADGAAGRPTARGIREPGLQLPLTARQARAQASLRGPHPQPARRPPPVHWVRGVLALRGAVRRLGAPLQGQGQLPARELRRARARGDICDPAQA